MAMSLFLRRQTGKACKGEALNSAELRIFLSLGLLEPLENSFPFA